MNGDKFLTVLGTVVTVALVTTIAVNGVDMRVAPGGYAGYPKNHVPLNVMRGN